MPSLAPGLPRLVADVVCARKNDKLGWTCGQSFQGPLGKFALRSNQQQVLSRLLQLVPAWCSPSKEFEVDSMVSLRVGPPTQQRGTKNFHIAYLGWTVVARNLNLEVVLSSSEDFVATMITQTQGVVTHAGDLLVRGDEAALVMGREEDRPEVCQRLRERDWTPFANRYVFYGQDGLALPYGNEGMAGTARVTEAHFASRETAPSPGEATLEAFQLAGANQDPQKTLAFLSHIMTSIPLLCSRPT